jgi:hypothetical protein
LYIIIAAGTAKAGTAAISGAVTNVLSGSVFVMQAGPPHGHVPVLYGESMVLPTGSTIRIGQFVTVTGSFNLIGQLIATSVVKSSPYHIATSAFDLSTGEGRFASAANVNRLVTYALGDNKALADCVAGTGCESMYYMDPNHVWNSSPASCVYHPDADEIAAASESWFVHDAGYTDSAHRVYGKDSVGCKIWEMNPNSTGLQTWWRSYLRTHADGYDFYFIDDNIMDVLDAGYFSHSGGGCIPWPSYCHTTQEIPTDAAEVSARANFVNALTHANGSPMKFLWQQASFVIPLDMSALNGTNRYVGITCEGCIASIATPVRPNLYAGVLNEMAAVNASHGFYMLLSKGESAAGSATQILQRLVTIGIVWLAYSEGHTAVRPNLEANTDNLAIWPEDLIYPSAPLQSMSTSSNDLQVYPGVYRREFGQCYQQGLPLGQCAAVVNANSYAVVVKSAWLKQSYHHVVALVGGDVLSGGIAFTKRSTFAANSTLIAPGGAALLAP